MERGVCGGGGAVRVKWEGGGRGVGGRFSPLEVSLLRGGVMRFGLIYVLLYCGTSHTAARLSRAVFHGEWESGASTGRSEGGQAGSVRGNACVPIFCSHCENGCVICTCII